MINKTHQFIILLAVGLAMLVSCTDSKQSIAPNGEVVDISELPSMIGDDIYTLMSDSGKLSYRMEAPKLAIFDKTDTPYWDFPEGLHITTFDKDGIENGDITSKFAIYHMNKDLWELQKDVVANAPGGERIETDLLFWDQKEERIYSDEYVEVHDDGMITKGYGFESDQEFTDWSIKDFEIEFYDVEEE